MPLLKLEKKNVIFALKLWLIMLITFITIMGILVVVTPIEDKNPPYPSINNNSEWGHSILKTSLQQTGYNVKQNIETSLALKKTDDSIIVIIEPSKKYSKIEIQHLISLLKKGQPIIILGSNKNTKALINELGYDMSPDYIVDPYYYHKSLIYPYAKTLNQDSFIFLKPKEINANGKSPFSTPQSYEPEYYYIYYPQYVYYQPIVETFPTSQFSVEYSLGQSFLNNYTIGIKDKNVPLIIVGDGWNTANFILKDYNHNKYFLKYLITLVDPENKRTNIIFEESTYSWAPTTSKGALNVLFSFFIRQSTSPSLFILFWIILPIASAFASKYLVIKIDTITPKVKKFTKKIQELYTKDIETVPLSLEERFLIKQDLILSHHPGTFTTAVAKQYLQIITDLGLIEKIPAFFIDPIIIVSEKTYPPENAWKVIENLVFAIKILDKYGEKTGYKILEKIAEEKVKEMEALV